jgi:thiol:disulfide interchange protein
MSKRILKLLAVASLAATILLLVSCTKETKEKPSDRVGWLTSYDDAVRLAEKDKRMIMIDFYADWCGWCKRLDNDTYVDRDVVAKAHEFVSLRVDADAERGLTSQYNVRGLPTILFIDPSGREVHRVVGFRSPTAFLAEMDVALQAFRLSRGS